MPAAVTESPEKKLNSKGGNFYQLYFEPTPAKMHPVVTKEPQILQDRYKIVVVGDYAVGKSSLVSRFCDDAFQEDHRSTIGIDHKLRMLTLPDQKKIKLELFDTAGLDKFRTVASNYYQNASGILVVYDLTDEQSFENISNYLRELKYFVPPDAEIMVVGNKSDLGQEERRVSYDKADKFCAQQGMSLFEVSAKTGLNVEAAFVELASKIREKIEIGTFDPSHLNGEDILYETEGDLNLQTEHQGSSFSWFFWCCV